MSDEFGTGEGLTRREALKKGARLGGALVWAVPVVQTIGMSPAMAQTVSEGNCCLRISLSEPVNAGFDAVGFAVVEFAWTLENCGSLNIDMATMIVDVSVNGGTTWTKRFEQDKGPIAPSQIIGETDTIKFDFEAETDVLFRAHGTFTCPGLSAEIMWHTIPGGGPDTYIHRGPLTVPAST